MRETNTEMDLGAVVSPYGPDDVIGAANQITEGTVLRAAGLVQSGRRFHLGQLVTDQAPHQMWRFWRQMLLTEHSAPGSGNGRNRMTFVEEAVSGAVHTGTHLDGLVHAGVDGVAYGGRLYSDIITASGVTELGIENMPPLVTRGVCLDVSHDVDSASDGANTAVTAQVLEAAEHRQGVTVGAGDILLLHTGWGRWWHENPDRYAGSEPGLDLGGAQWCVDRKVSVIGADTWAVEQVPSADPEDAFAVHQLTITRNGIYLLENARTSELADSGVSEFLCVIAPILLQGASASMVAPVAVI